MSGTISEIHGIEIEHGLGASTGKGFVKVRVTTSTGIAVDNLRVADARQVANHMLEACARAEYEQDILAGMPPTAKGEGMAAAIMTVVRRGEVIRHTTATETQP